MILKKGIDNLLKNYSIALVWVFFIIVFICYPYFFSNKKIEISSEDVIKRVGELIVLPADEKPTVATVANLDYLKDNQFFKNARIGDKVLVYVKSGKSILFRLDQNKIVEIGNLNLKK
ncbi:MAG: hypothetical protein WCO84_04400 [bacterium]